jgi:hypothetical protein
MSKPDWCSPDIWDQTERIVDREAVARLLMNERERCERHIRSCAEGGRNFSDALRAIRKGY